MFAYNFYAPETGDDTSVNPIFKIYFKTATPSNTGEIMATPRYAKIVNYKSEVNGAPIVLLAGHVYRITDDVKTLYEQNGGSPTLDGYYSVNQTGHTVFGQIFEGLDVLDAIAAVETDSNTDKPLTDVVINSITIEQYHAE